MTNCALRFQGSTSDRVTNAPAALVFKLSIWSEYTFLVSCERDEFPGALWVCRSLTK